MPQIEIDEDIFLPCYTHILEKNDIDIEFIWGGRDSGKSHFVAQKLILDCLQSNYFRCIMIKKTHESIKDSQWQTIKDIVEDWNLQDYFKFKVSPLEIECVNGNRFIARGCDNPTKLKSIRNPSHAWYEEGDQITLEDFTTISTTLRTNTGKVKQFFVFNPELPKGVIDKNDFWLYKNYFSHTTDKNFTHKIEFEHQNRKINITYRSTHTTYKENLDNVTEDRIVTHENLKNTNPSKYLPYTLGEWGQYTNELPFFYAYNKLKHYTYEKYLVNSDNFLDISFDFNITPCVAVIGQYDRHNRKYAVFKAIIQDHTNYYNTSSLVAVCREIKKQFLDNGLIPRYRIRITGDASGKSGSADRQKAQSYYYTIKQELGLNDNQFYIRNTNLQHIVSGEVINTILNDIKEDCFLIYDIPELDKDIQSSFPDAKQTLNEAKAKFGLHVLDAWRYLIDLWFGINTTHFITNASELIKLVNQKIKYINECQNNRK